MLYTIMVILTLTSRWGVTAPFFEADAAKGDVVYHAREGKNR